MGDAAVVRHRARSRAYRLGQRLPVARTRGGGPADFSPGAQDWLRDASDRQDRTYPNCSTSSIFCSKQCNIFAFRETVVLQPLAVALNSHLSEIIPVCETVARTELVSVPVVSPNGSASTLARPDNTPHLRDTTLGGASRNTSRPSARNCRPGRNTWHCERSANGGLAGRGRARRLFRESKREVTIRCCWVARIGGRGRPRCFS